MKRLWTTIIITYEDLKIKDKFMLFVGVLMAVFILFIITGLQYAFHAYDEQIYRKSSQSLAMSTNTVENELRRIEDVSFEIITDTTLLHSAKEALEVSTRYEQYGVQTTITNRLSDYVGSERYIHSIYFIDANGTMYSAGNTLAPATQEEKNRLVKEAEAEQGGLFWVTSGGTNRFVTAARQMRSHENLNLENLGTVVIRVNLAKIVASLPEEWEDTKGNIMISNGERMFFSEEESRPFWGFDFSSPSGQGYMIEELNGNTYFVTFVKTAYENWTYWQFIPFDTVFSTVSKLKVTLFIAFALLMAAAAFAVIHFTRKMTTPIEELVETMRHIQKGDFAIAETLPPPPRYQDEIGLLHRNFTFMVKRINELIKENYEKQILLKETEFKALQSQINPHFLYNTLESINWLAKANKQPQISKMVESLAYLLRHSVNVKEDVVTIRHELDLVSRYVTIQQYRFDDRLDFVLSVDDDVLDCRIPKLTVQPLIENAIHYALEQMMEPCTITIRAFRDGERVHVIVKDNGPGMDEQFLEKLHKGEVKTRGTGIGLKNIDERTKLFFGEPYGLSIQSKQGCGTAVDVLLPFETEENNHVQRAAGG